MPKTKKIGFEKLKQLHPETRIKTLKTILEEFQAKKSQDPVIAEVREELRKAQDELERLEEEEHKERKPARIEELFEEKPEEAKKPLETIAEQETPRPHTQHSFEEREAYVNVLARKPARELYEGIRAIREKARESGALNAYQQEQLDTFSRAVRQKEEAYARQNLDLADLQRLEKEIDKTKHAYAGDTTREAYKTSE